MKKASIVLLVVLLLFFSTIVGYLLGHRITNNDIIISSENPPIHLSNSSTDNDSAFTSDGKININIASVGQLLMLPNVGETLAMRIVEYRNQYGKFYSVEDLLLVKGIGEKKLEQLRDYITIGG